MNQKLANQLLSNPMGMKHKYEIMVVFSSQIAADEINKYLQEIKDLLGDEIVFEEIWGTKPFAFKIKNEDKGYYAVWNFIMTAAQINTLEDSLKHNPKLLRHLILRVPENYKTTTLDKIETGVEKLLKEKADKRQGGRKKKPTSDNKEDRAKTPLSLIESEQPATSAHVSDKEEKVAAEKAAEPAPVTEDKPITKETEKKRKDSLDEKLDAILSDADLGL